MEPRKYGAPPRCAVAVHGGPGAPGSVSSLARRLSQYTGVVEPFQSEMSVSGQVRELAEQIESDADPPAYVFGHSWGAWLVYLLAHRSPGLVQKVFLIGSGAFDASYLPELKRRRRSRLTESEREEYDELPRLIEATAGPKKEALLSRLGALAGKADSYCVEEAPGDSEGSLALNAAQFSAVWPEASRMREEGHFTGIAHEIQVPIRVIHGEHDPTPIEGVIDPIKDQLTDLKWYKLPKCGHDPWKEKHAKSEFWRIVSDELAT